MNTLDWGRWLAGWTGHQRHFDGQLAALGAVASWTVVAGVAVADDKLERSHRSRVAPVVAGAVACRRCSSL